MSRNPHTGEKSSPKSWRRHTKAVDEAIRKFGNAATDDDARPMSPAMIERWDSTWQHAHRASQRAQRRPGGARRGSR